MRFILPLASLILAAGCADSEPPDSTPIEDGGPYNMIDPVAAPLADEAEPAIGQWIRSMQEERPALQFGPPNTEPLFSIRCDDRDGLILQRHGVVQTGSAQMMTLTMAGSSQQLAVNPVAGPLPVLRAAVQPTDPLIENLRNAEQPIRIEIGDEPPLILPASSAIGEFVEECAGASGAQENEAAAEDGAE